MDNTTQPLTTTTQTTSFDPVMAQPFQPVATTEPMIDTSTMTPAAPIPAATTPVTAQEPIVDDMALDLDGYDGDDGDDGDEDYDQESKTKNDALLEEAEMMDIVLEERKKATEELKQELARIKAKYETPEEESAPDENEVAQPEAVTAQPTEQPLAPVPKL